MYKEEFRLNHGFFQLSLYHIDHICLIYLLSSGVSCRNRFFGKTCANRQTNGPVQCLTCVVFVVETPCFSITAVALILFLYFTSFGFNMLL